MAEHKGYAIAAMVDMLSGVLTGSGFLSAVRSPRHTAEYSYATPYADIEPDTWLGVMACQCQPSSRPGLEPQYPETPGQIGLAEALPRGHR